MAKLSDRGGRVFCLIFGVAMGGAGCGAVTPDEEVEVASSALTGDPLPGLTQAQKDLFAAGLDAFTEVETVALGVGPFFNEQACGNCHTEGGIGGSGKQFEVRAGILSANGSSFDSLGAKGGQLFDLFSITRIPLADRPGTAGCTLSATGVPIPPEANIIAQRRTTALFGLGFVDATPDATFKLMAALQPSSIRGRAPLVDNIQAGRKTVGKFGWKDQNPTLHQFSGDAYLNEMGITNPEFPNEQTGGVSLAARNACDVVPGLENDGEDVDNFTNFMTLLAPPPRGRSTIRSALGDILFTTTGCAGCHVRNIVSGPSPIAALSNKVYHPFSDFLLHDMGTGLGDGVGNNGTAAPREMRTAPLWGLRFVAPTDLLHDGRATSLSDAILKHGGQALDSRNRFAALGTSAKQDLLEFLNTL